MDCDVLICGLGPVGQLLALLLGHLGVSTIGIDQAAEPYALPRAAVIDDEVLRIFQSIDLDHQVLKAAQVQKAVSFLNARGEAYEVFRPAHGELGQPPLVSIHQPSIERMMVTRLTELGQAQLQWEQRVETIDQDAMGVSVWVRPVTGGRAYALRGRYLVGCDGGRSTVRSRLQIPFGGSTFAQRWLVVDATVDRPVVRAPHPHFSGNLERPTVSLPMSPGRHRWEWMLHSGEPEADFVKPDRIRRLMGPWLTDEQVEVERAVVYTFHARTAHRWRVGRMFLAGDAAHVMPPFVGQGFSSGARDAANLAWKLDAALSGSPSVLLDSYEAERRPHVTGMQTFAVRSGAVVQTTRPGVGRFRDSTMELMQRSGLAAWIQDRAKPLPTCGRGAFAERPARFPPRRSVGALFPQPTHAGAALDSALGSGWSAVVTDPQVGHGLLTAGLHTVALPDDRWLIAHRATWAILRPDRYVFACGDAREIGPAVAALRRQVGAGLRSQHQSLVEAVAA